MRVSIADAIHNQIAERILFWGGSGVGGTGLAGEDGGAGAAFAGSFADTSGRCRNRP